MKVWLVMENLDYEGERVVAIYSSQESARSHRDAAIAGKNGLPWSFSVEEREVLS